MWRFITKDESVIQLQDDVSALSGPPTNTPYGTGRTSVDKRR